MALSGILFSLQIKQVKQTMRRKQVKDRASSKITRASNSYPFDALLFLSLSLAGFSDYLTQNIVSTFYPFNKGHRVKGMNYKIESHLGSAKTADCSCRCIA